MLAARCIRYHRDAQHSACKTRDEGKAVVSECETKHSLVDVARSGRVGNLNAANHLGLGHLEPRETWNGTLHRLGSSPSFGFACVQHGQRQANEKHGDKGEIDQSTCRRRSRSRHNKHNTIHLERRAPHVFER